MDVELLRPGTVPIAPDTVLWFEFLLHKDLLLNHLQKPSPDPSPTELITKFSDAVTDSLRNRLDAENGEPVVVVEAGPQGSAKHPAKNIALKILSLKVAAFIKWNIAEIRRLSFKTQINLLQDLMYFTNDNTVMEIPNIEHPEDVTEISQPHIFALMLYYRWLLNVAMQRIHSNWQIRFGYFPNYEISHGEENAICSVENVNKAVDFLRKSLTWPEVPGLLTFDCFKLPIESSGSSECDWMLVEPVSKQEFVAQISFELGTFFFYKEDYDLAKEHFNMSLENFTKVKESGGFLSLDLNVLEVYVKTCHGPQEGAKGSLAEQLNASIVNLYMGITSILQQDNVYREVPLPQRINLELDIQGAICSGKFTVARDLLYKVRALNVVRCVLERKPVYPSSPITPKTTETLVWAIEVSWRAFNDSDKTLLKNYLLEQVLKDDLPDLLATIQASSTLSKVFEKSELQYIKGADVTVEIPDSLFRTDWIVYDFGKKRKPKMEVRQLYHQLISTYDYKEIRELLAKITKNHNATSVWNINPRWEIPIPLQSVLKSLPRGPLQDFGLVMLAKAREQMLNKSWNSSLELLLILDKELDPSNGVVAKLSRLISWEILLVQITQMLEEWPRITIERSALANACESCLQANESVLPRTEVTEHCVLCLLNLGMWETVLGLDKRWPSSDITCAIAMACQDLVKHKGNKKLPKNLWEIVLPIFAAPPSQNKRGGSSGGGSQYHDTHIASLRNSIMAVFSKLRDSTVLAVVISMLARLHNVLKDEQSLELQIEYTTLWPAVVSNANSYNTQMACETLDQMVTQGLRYYPNNVSWLRLMGDINFARGHYSLSLKFYLKSLLICYDYFNIPVRYDDHVFRRMIKCCVALGCTTQAAVLCQFLEEPDYVLAFRILGEQKVCNDAVDAYYPSIWDTNILEYLVHTHNKRGEQQRRKCAMQIMGLLELNSNNNEEIQREASNLRKSTFLRALCKQYVY